MDERLNEEVPSAFDPANFNTVLLIQMMRLYDLQLAMLSALDPEKAKALAQMHEAGQTFCPAPAYTEES